MLSFNYQFSWTQKAMIFIRVKSCKTYNKMEVNNIFTANEIYV
jgi:hypothetical protein